MQALPSRMLCMMHGSRKMIRCQFASLHVKWSSLFSFWGSIKVLLTASFMANPGPIQIMKRSRLLRNLQAEMAGDLEVNAVLAELESGKTWMSKRMLKSAWGIASCSLNLLAFSPYKQLKHIGRPSGQGSFTVICLNNVSWQ